MAPFPPRDATPDDAAGDVALVAIKFSFLISEIIHLFFRSPFLSPPPFFPPFRSMSAQISKLMLFFFLLIFSLFPLFFF